MPLGELFGMLVAFGLMVGLPMTAILTSHQRKMAEMLHRQRQEQGLAPDAARKIQQLEAEVFELKQTLQGHIIATDRLISSQLEFQPVSQSSSTTPPLPEGVRAQLGRSVE
jgi:hypothetical protein